MHWSTASNLVGVLVRDFPEPVFEYLRLLFTERGLGLQKYGSVFKVVGFRAISWLQSI